MEKNIITNFALKHKLEQEEKERDEELMLKKIKEELENK